MSRAPVAYTILQKVMTHDPAASEWTASGKVLRVLGAVIPELWGGSAGLAGSNNTTIGKNGSLLPAGNPLPGAYPYGRTIHFGIREHSMAAMASPRAIPGPNVVRPADANETAIAWAEILKRHATDPAPHGLALTRQGVPAHAPNEDAAKGGYVLRESSTETQEVIIIATGSEVQPAVAARELPEAEGIRTRVVPVPCVERFDEQPPAYREQVLPPTVRDRVAVAAGIGLTWHRFLDDAGPDRLPRTRRRLRRRGHAPRRARLHPRERRRRRPRVTGRHARLTPARQERRSL